MEAVTVGMGGGDNAGPIIGSYGPMIESGGAGGGG